MAITKTDEEGQAAQDHARSVLPVAKPPVTDPKSVRLPGTPEDQWVQMHLNNGTVVTESRGRRGVRERFQSGSYKGADGTFYSFKGRRPGDVEMFLRDQYKSKFGKSEAAKTIDYQKQIQAEGMQTGGSHNSLRQSPVRMTPRQQQNPGYENPTPVTGPGSSALPEKASVPSSESVARNSSPVSKPTFASADLKTIHDVGDGSTVNGQPKPQQGSAPAATEQQKPAETTSQAPPVKPATATGSSAPVAKPAQMGSRQQFYADQREARMKFYSDQNGTPATPVIKPAAAKPAQDQPAATQETSTTVAKPEHAKRPTPVLSADEEEKGYQLANPVEDPTPKDMELVGMRNGSRVYAPPSDVYGNAGAASAEDPFATSETSGQILAGQRAKYQESQQPPAPKAIPVAKPDTTSAPPPYKARSDQEDWARDRTNQANLAADQDHQNRLTRLGDTNESFKWGLMPDGTDATPNKAKEYEDNLQRRPANGNEPAAKVISQRPATAEELKTGVAKSPVAKPKLTASSY